MSSYASLCFLSYNRPQFIEESIRSAVENAGYPCEVIVHDDGSNPEAHRRTWTRDVLTRLLDEGYVSHLILNPSGHNEGVGTAINRMFKIASGDPVIKLDQDLLFQGGWLARVVGILRQDPIIGMLGLFKYHHEPVRWQDKMVHVPTKGGYHYTRQFCGSGFAIPRRVWEACGPLEEHSDAFAEDMDYMKRVRVLPTKPGEQCTDYHELALPDVDLVTNRGFGPGPSTVVAHSQERPGEIDVAKIHHRPHIVGAPLPETVVLPETADEPDEATPNAKTCDPQNGVISPPAEEPGSFEYDWSLSPSVAEGAMAATHDFQLRRFNVGVVVTMCAGREQNLERLLSYLNEVEVPPGADLGPVVVVCDGCKPPAHLQRDTRGRDPQVFFEEIPKHHPGMEQPRNVGARLLREIERVATHVWFLDSDMIVPSDIFESFCRGFCASLEDRVLIGPYDWLAPGVVGFVPELQDVMPMVMGSQGMPDYRWASFKEHGPQKVFRFDLGVGLACFGGNLIWPLDQFDRIGGFHRDLHHGRCEDGELGLRACERGVPMSLVRAARAWHVWHPIDTADAVAKNQRDVPLLDAMHPWVQDQGLLVVDEDGKRFDWRCPHCGDTHNSLSYWTHKETAHA